MVGGAGSVIRRRPILTGGNTLVGLARVSQGKETKPRASGIAEARGLGGRRSGVALELERGGQHDGVDRVVPRAVERGGDDAVVDLAGLAVNELVGGVEGPLGGVVAEADGEEV